MPEDVEKDVQSDVVSEETTLPEVLPSPEVEEVEKPLTMKQLEEILTKTLEPISRRIQGADDRSQAALDRARMLEEISTDIGKGFAEADPEGAESAKLKARVKFYEQRDAMIRQQQAAMTHHQRFLDNMKQFIVESGVDVNDKGIDWGKDTRDYIEMQDRILTSVAKVQKEKSKVGESKASQKAKDLENLARKEVDSVETLTPMGAGKGIPTDRVALEKWVNNLSVEEYKKLKPDIDKMMAQGKIK